MLLSELDHKSKLIELASKDGIKTVEEFNIWLTGYMTGYREGLEKLTENIDKGLYNELQNM